MLLLTLIASFASLASAVPRMRVANEVLAKRAPPPAYVSHYFDQPIDHFPHDPRYAPHTKATFKQRYVFDSSYYKPGGPIFLYISGETSVESRFSNLETGIIQILMQATNGLGVILENRYYGESFPFTTMTTDEMAYLTQEQTIADNAYFAQRATFPGIPGNLTAPATPWIMYGGSLAGAETAFTMKTYGDILFAGIAASGTTKAMLAYPQWYDPIQKYGPQDCIASINAIVDKIDYLVDQKNSKAIQELKAIFGLEALTDIRDFAMTIGFPLGGPMFYPTNTWQELNWNPGYTSTDFFDFCSNVTDINSPADITAVDTALAQYTKGEAWYNLGNYAAYVKRVIVPLCVTGDINSSLNGCFGTQNATFWADTSISEDRSYVYTTCVESGGYLVGQPPGKPSLVSRVLQIDYTQQWCDWSFAPGKYNKIPKTPDLTQWNKYGGYSVEADRLAHVDGATDVWLDLCYHSNFAPPRYPSTSDLHPEYLINGGGHHWDSTGIKNISAEPQFIKDVHLWEIKTVKKWLKEGRNGKGHYEL